MKEKIISLCIVLIFSVPVFANGNVKISDTEIPAGNKFIKIKNYLPGDQIVITNIENGKDFEAVVIGSLPEKSEYSIIINTEICSQLQMNPDYEYYIKIEKRKVSDKKALGTAKITCLTTEEEIAEKEQLKAALEVQLESENQTEQNIEQNTVEQIEESENETEEILVEAEPEQQEEEVDSAENEVVQEEQIEEVPSENQIIIEETVLPEEKTEVIEPEQLQEEYFEEEQLEEVEQPENTENNQVTESLSDVIEEIPVEEDVQEETVEPEAFEEEKLEELSEAVEFYEPEAAEEQIDNENNVEQIDSGAPEYTEELVTEEYLVETSETIVEELQEENQIPETVELESIQAVENEEEVEEVILLEETALPAFEIAPELQEEIQVDEVFEAIELPEAEDSNVIISLPPVEETVSVESVVQKEENTETQKIEVATIETSIEENKTESVASAEVSEPAPVVNKTFDKFIITQKDFVKGKYYIQIAAYKNEDNITEVINKYSKKYPVKLIELSDNRGYKILIGPVAIDEYKIVLERFKSYGFKDAFARKVE